MHTFSENRGTTSRDNEASDMEMPSKPTSGSQSNRERPQRTKMYAVCKSSVAEFIKKKDTGEASSHVEETEVTSVEQHPHHPITGNLSSEQQFQKTQYRLWMVLIACVLALILFLSIALSERDNTAPELRGIHPTEETPTASPSVAPEQAAGQETMAPHHPPNTTQEEPSFDGETSDFLNSTSMPTIYIETQIPLDANEDP